MRSFYAIAILLFASFSLAVAQDAPEASGAKMEFESKTVDYGTIEHKADGQREFTFTNTGTEDLIITTCKGSCGCTVPQCPKEVIKPGQTGSIKVKYDTNRQGAFTKTVTVNANTAESPYRLIIKGTVKSPASSESDTSTSGE